MPLLNKSMSLATLTCCVAGMCCAELSAQAPQAAPRRTVNNGAAPQRGAAATKVAGAPAQPGRAPLENRPALPQVQPLRIPKLTPEMEDILVEWEQKSAQIQRLEGTFKRITYDKVFAIEQVSDGKYCFKFPDLGSFDQKGSKVEGKRGRLYPQKPGPDERWVCDGMRILKIDDKADQYEEIGIPPEDRGQNIRNSPLPFLFGMKANEAKQRYYIEMNKEKSNENSVWLKVQPLMQQDLANYKMAEVVLDRTHFLPIAVKLYDTTGNKEDVYLFDQSPGSMTVNGRSWKQWLAGDPLKPDLRGYKKMIAPANAAAPGEQLLAPAGRRPVSIQPAGIKSVAPRSAAERTAELPADDDVPAPRTTRKQFQP